MTTSLLDRFTTHVETIDARAATIDARRVAAIILAVLTFPFFVVGVVAAVLWAVVRWSIAGALGGWELVMQTIDAFSQTDQPGQGQGRGRGLNRGS